MCSTFELQLQVLLKPVLKVGALKEVEVNIPIPVAESQVYERSEKAFFIVFAKSLTRLVVT